jgi:fumarate hydratase subunit beta
MEDMRISAPLDAETARALRAGQRVLLSGTIYTARDAAHRKLCELLASGGEPPFELKGSVIYYCGPAPAPPGRPIGSAGPTSSYRMDVFVPALMEAGMLGMIGKGPRSEAVKRAVVSRGGVYFAATGGAGALLAGCVLSSELVAWPELGPEAVRRLEVRDLPLTTVLDALGGDLYEQGPAAYLAALARP